MMKGNKNMAKTPKQAKFRNFESSEYFKDFKEPYIRITRSMLTNERWLKLSYSAKTIYIYMKLWSYGREEFSFSYKLALNIVKSRSTFKSSIDELVDNGFIEIIRISRTPGVGTKYKFSNKWYKP